MMLVVCTFSFGYQTDKFDELGFYKQDTGNIVVYQRENNLDSLIVLEDMVESEFDAFVNATMMKYGSAIRGVEEIYATDSKVIYRCYRKNGRCLMFTFELKDGVYYNAMYTPKSNTNATPKDISTRSLLEL